VSLVIDAPAGTITVPDSTLLAIAVTAAERVEGVRVLRRRSIDLDQPLVRLALSARRGEPLLELARRAQDGVALALEQMCGIDAKVELTVGALA
jgi:uncharacterized alkaline shock family protein YloU